MCSERTQGRMAFQVYDIPGQPLVCCNRTLAEHCIEVWPFLDSFVGTCTVVQEVNPFEEFNKNASAPVIFVLNNPAWVVWIGCVAARHPCKCLNACTAGNNAGQITVALLTVRLLYCGACIH